MEGAGETDEPYPRKQVIHGLTEAALSQLDTQGSSGVQG